MKQRHRVITIASLMGCTGYAALTSTINLDGVGQNSAVGFNFSSGKYDYITRPSAGEPPMSEQWVRMFVDDLKFPNLHPAIDRLSTERAARRASELVTRYSKSSLKRAYENGILPTPRDGSDDWVAAGLAMMQRHEAWAFSKAERSFDM